jgi:hypothetical protein
MTKKKALEALSVAKLLAKEAKCATDFHNAFFGIGGEFGKLFPTKAERTAFMKTPEYREIFRMRSEMRKTEKVVL